MFLFDGYKKNKPGKFHSTFLLSFERQSLWEYVQFTVTDPAAAAVYFQVT